MMKTIFFTSMQGLERNLNSGYERSYSFWTDTEIQSLINNSNKSLICLSKEHGRSENAIQIMLDKHCC